MEIFQAIIKKDFETLEKMKQNEKFQKEKITNQEQKTPLHFAIEKENSIEMIKILIDLNAEQILMKDLEERTPLHYICSIKPNKEIIELLIEKGAKISDQDQMKKQPLHDLCLSKPRMDCIKILIEKGACINAKDKYGITPLHYALISKSNWEVIQYMLEKGADVSAQTNFQETPLHFACENGIEESVELLLQKGANPNEKSMKGNSALFFACHCLNNRTKIFELLFKYGADINLINNSERTASEELLSWKPDMDSVLIMAKHKKPSEIINVDEKNLLHIACENQVGAEIIKFFASQVDVNHIDLDKKTPLHYACANNLSEEIIYSLINSKAKINSFDSDGKTAFNYLWEISSNLDLLKFFIRKGSDLSKSESLKKSPESYWIFACQYASDLELFQLLPSLTESLMNQVLDQDLNLLGIALKTGKPLEIIKYLVGKGAKITTEIPRTNYTSIHLACKFNSSFEVLEFLLQHGSQVLSKQNSFPPLFLACSSNIGKEKIKLLIDYGADISFIRVSDETALQHACEQGADLETIKLLYSPKTINFPQHHGEGLFPLMLACINGCSSEVIQYLISQGADLNSESYYHRTIFYYVPRFRNPKECVEILFRNGAKLTADPSWGSPLHACCSSKCDLETLQLIIDKTQDINQKTTGNKTALDLAIIKGMIDNIKLLLMNNAIISENALSLFEGMRKTKEKINTILSTFYSVKEDFSNLYKNKEFSDFVIESSDGLKIPTHSLILSARLSEINSNHLYQKLNDFHEIISHFNGEAINIFVEFLYTGDGRNSEEVLSIAEKIGYNFDWVVRKSGIKGLLEDMKLLLKQEDSMDFIIQCKNQEIKCHKLILATRSDLFRGMFLNVNDSSNQVNDYTERDPETIRIFIEYLYNNKLRKKLDPKTVEELIDIDEYYQLNSPDHFKKELEKEKK
eukprot:Anaeramoba_ignava/a484424_25.p1 GENE.a484424_25~~a484424_25.p1  ORF type:complete len:922 (-),score=328.90 a484424_25:85-2850(-)